MTQKHIIMSNLLWGLLLWLFGYVLGFFFFAFVPQPYLGWAIMPFGIAATIWVLLKKVRRDRFSDYIIVGLLWTVIAVVFDYLFIVRLLSAADYYKLDVYLYYALTFLLPVVVGWRVLSSKAQVQASN